ncbi:MAG: hypothetical protein IKK30_06720 [Clostridia bacterium]|nr:hypothetical protein [Clostridia bacterium]
MPKKTNKKSELLPCICYFPRADMEERRYEDMTPEEREAYYIRYEDMTEEERLAHKAKREKRLSEGMTRFYEEHPEIYHHDCQSDLFKEYDRKHGYI